jgi:hypothetical protein
LALTGNHLGTFVARRGASQRVEVIEREGGIHKGRKGPEEDIPTEVVLQVHFPTSLTMRDQQKIERVGGHYYFKRVTVFR